MSFPEDGHKSGRNMQEVYYVHNITSDTLKIYMHLLFSSPYRQRAVSWQGYIRLPLGALYNLTEFSHCLLRSPLLRPKVIPEL